MGDQQQCCGHWPRRSGRVFGSPMRQSRSSGTLCGCESNNNKVLWPVNMHACHAHNHRWCACGCEAKWSALPARSASRYMRNALSPFNRGMKGAPYRKRPSQPLATI